MKSTLLTISATFACTSKFFCDGPVLDKIQSSPHITDGKYFVDMASARPEEDILADFYKLPEEMDKEDLNNFLGKNFFKPGYELDHYPATPKFLTHLKDERVQSFGNSIHNLWGTLIRKFNGTKLCDGCESSLIDMKYSFVVPGGRFREFYYWDSFFVLEGLNLSNLGGLSKNMLMNFLDFVNEIGHIPNAARKYMLNRSQPPFLAASFDKYLQKTNDVAFLASSINLLGKEYDYWRSKHDVQLHAKDKIFLTRYIVNCTKPRPESYREDMMTVRFATGITEDAKKALYADLAAGAESGWDYSSRWIPDATVRLEDGPVTQEDMLRGLRTSSILPVDLNSLMYLNERTLAKFHRQAASMRSHTRCTGPGRTHHLKKADYFDSQADARAKLMYEFMWDSEHKSFFDYDMNSGRKVKRFSPSNIWPFWADALTPDFRKDPTNHLLAFATLDKERTKRAGSTPTTHLNSSLQWDYPNAWAPLEYVSIEALLKSQKLLKSMGIDAPQLRAQAKDIATRFFQSTFCAWHSTGGSTKTLPKRSQLSDTQNGYLFEKYNADQIGKVGRGGEYHVQTGFGWTNGVVVHLINLFGNELELPSDINKCLSDIEVPNEKMSYGRSTPYEE